MVKVVGLTDEERALREKTSKLVRLTENNVSLGQEVTLSFAGNILVSHFSPQASGDPIFVSPDRNLVTVDSHAYCEVAKRLAEIYEAAFPDDGEFTVKKNYED
ncbi:MAG: hypothetical protein KJ879_01100 [Nanoarchaeota archaeon]|nr:hypothetical protein [Nanoarchaeota archaeon]